MRKTVLRIAAVYLALMAFFTLASHKLDELRTPVVMTVSPSYGVIGSEAYECVLPAEALHPDGDGCCVYIVEEGTSYFYPLVARRVSVKLEASDGTRAAVSGVYTRGLSVVRYASRPLDGSTVPVALWEEDGE